MQLVLTGTGTSQGVPVIGCSCKVCQSLDFRDKRSRSGALLSLFDSNLAIDIGPDFRQQMLSQQVKHLTALLITHEHNDHLAGLDDIRPFNFMQKNFMPVYALPRVIKEIQSRFAYIFSKDPYPGSPMVSLYPVVPHQELRIGQFTIMPFIVYHGDMEVLAFRCGQLSYITDASAIPDTAAQVITGSEILVINALHHHKHHSHFNLKEALEQIRKFKPRLALITHISHSMGLTSEINQMLPAGVSLGYDNQIIDI